MHPSSGDSVVIDSRMSPGEHVASVSRSGYYQLRQHAACGPVFVGRCHQDVNQRFHCQSPGLLQCSVFGITNELFCRLQSVQNAAARLVTGAKRSDHISSMLRHLHWLPVRQRVVFKIATIVCRSLSGHAPGYLADDCQLVTDARAKLLRSADTRTLTVHRTSSCFGDRTFAAGATIVWNSLPADLRKTELSYSRFRQSLKTLLFRQSDNGVL